MNIFNRTLIVACALAGVLQATSVEAAQVKAAQASDAVYDAQMREVEELIHEGNKLAQDGKYKEAIPVLEKALKLSEANLGEGPYTALVLTGLGFVYANDGRFDDAEKADLRALAIREQLAPDGDQRTLELLVNIGLLYTNTQRYSQAEPYLLRAVAMGEIKFGPDDAKTGYALQCLGEMYLKVGREAEAKPILERADKIRTRSQ